MTLPKSLLITRKEPYRDPMVDYGAMSAMKNAPRWIKQLKLIGRWPETISAPANQQ